jgi:hypothetical protein
MVLYSEATQPRQWAFEEVAQTLAGPAAGRIAARSGAGGRLSGALLRTLGIDRAHVVDQSYGGVIALLEPALLGVSSGPQLLEAGPMAALYRGSDTPHADAESARCGGSPGCVLCYDNLHGLGLPSTEGIGPGCGPRDRRSLPEPIAYVQRANAAARGKAVLAD